MSDPSRIGIGLPTGVHTLGRQQHCPGALLRVTREDFRELKAAGEVFSTGDKEVAAEGYSDARAFCTRAVEEIRTTDLKRQDGTSVVGITYAGLCKWCGTLERNNRADLTKRKNQ